MRVAVITTSYPRYPGDHAGSFVQASVRAMENAGGRVTVVAPDDPAVPGSSAAIRRVRYHPLRSRQRLAYGDGIPEALEGPRRAWLQAPGLVGGLAAVAVSAARKADLVVGHWLLPGGLVAAMAARVAGVPHSLVLHSAGISLAERIPGGRHLARAAAGGAHHVIITSEPLRQRFDRLLGPKRARSLASRVSVLPMGYDLAGLGPSLDRRVARSRLGVTDRFTVGFLGRVVPVKGLDHLVRAVARLPGAALLVGGQGPELASARRTAGALGVELITPGTIRGDERRGFLSACDVVAVPSIVLAGGRTEGSPVGLVEAMACGLPVIASDVGGLPDLVRDGRTGYIVPPADAAALAHRLAGLRSDPRLRRRLGRAARESVANREWSVVGPRFSALLMPGAG